MLEGAVPAGRRVETALGEFAVARKHFRAGAEADPANVVLLGAWARMEALSGDLPRAQQLFQAAFAQNPDNIVLLQVLLALAYTHTRTVLDEQ